MPRLLRILLYRDSRGMNVLRLTAAIGCATFMTVMLLSRDPWALLGFQPKADDDLFVGSNDKLYHTVGYFALTISMLCVGLVKSRRVYIGLAIAAGVHAVLIETLQQFVPSRHTDVLDLCANFVGFTLGCGLAAYLRRLGWTAPLSAIAGDTQVVTGGANDSYDG